VLHLLAILEAWRLVGTVTQLESFVVADSHRARIVHANSSQELLDRFAHERCKDAKDDFNPPSKALNPEEEVDLLDSVALANSEPT
jgi:hypothetical protein